MAELGVVRRCYALSVNDDIPRLSEAERHELSEYLQRLQQDDIYGRQLHIIADLLLRAGFPASIRGEGAARFVYVEHGTRAAEISHDGVGFFVELFEEPHEASLRDYQQDTPEFATEDAIAWLSRNDRNA